MGFLVGGGQRVGSLIIIQAMQKKCDFVMPLISLTPSGEGPVGLFSNQDLQNCESGKHCGSLHFRDCVFIQFIPSGQLKSWVEEKVSFLTSIIGNIKEEGVLLKTYSALQSFELPQNPQRYCTRHGIIPSADFWGYQLPAKCILKSIFLLIVTLQIVPHPSGGSSH